MSPCPTCSPQPTHELVIEPGALGDFFFTVGLALGMLAVSVRRRRVVDGELVDLEQAYDG